MLPFTVVFPLLISSRRFFISERRYGCYRLGLLVAVVIIFILLIGSVPVFVTTDNSKLILIVLIITLILVGLLVFAYFEWQRRTALRMRQNSIRGTYSTMERRTREQQVQCNAIALLKPPVAYVYAMQRQINEKKYKFYSSLGKCLIRCSCRLVISEIFKRQEETRRQEEAANSILTCLVCSLDHSPSCIHLMKSAKTFTNHREI